MSLLEYEDAPVRYPYLVTPLAPGEPPRTDESNSSTLLQDVDMGGGPQLYSSEIKYIALDTNALIDNIHLVQRLYSALAKSPDARLCLLVPNTVVGELDKLKSSDRPAGVTPKGQVTTGNLARAATKWLFETNRLQKTTNCTILRFQKWSERIHEDRDKADDQILDCCLFFQQYSHVSLWTSDRNLALLAETHDIPTIGGYNVSPATILKTCKVQLLPSAMADLCSSSPMGPMLEHSLQIEDDGMELDVDLTQMHQPHQSPCTPPAIPSVLPASPTPTPLRPITRQTSFAPAPPTSLPPDILAALTQALQPAVATLNLFAPPSAAQSASATLNILLSALLAHESSSTTPRLSSEHIDLLRSISATRTVLSFVEEKNTQGRKVRTGEVADSLQLLAGTLTSLGCLPSPDPLEAVSIAIRDLP